uniref:Uncharacterized protein n=1 Tax=Moniliophthora roreri TaxID=221103 RepID=A0A0W0GC18_MONRR
MPSISYKHAYLKNVKVKVKYAKVKVKYAKARVKVENP